MSIAYGLQPEFDQEMATTRKLLARVPSDKGPWKPHPKSFPLGHLAQLMATMPGWLTQTLRDTEIDLATSPGYSFEITDTLLEAFDRHVREAREALASAEETDFSILWSLKKGDQVHFTAPRGTVVPRPALTGGRVYIEGETVHTMKDGKISKNFLTP